MPGFARPSRRAAIVAATASLVLAAPLVVASQIGSEVSAEHDVIVDRLDGVWIDEIEGEGNEHVIAWDVPPGPGARGAPSDVVAELIEAAQAQEVSIGALGASLRDGTVVGRVRVRYTFAQLSEWRALMRPLLARDFVTMLDADERAGSVAVGVHELAYRQAVLDHAHAVGVPAHVVAVVEARFSTMLTGAHRPDVGG